MAGKFKEFKDKMAKGFRGSNSVENVSKIPAEKSEEKGPEEEKMHHRAKSLDIDENENILNTQELNFLKSKFSSGRRSVDGTERPGQHFQPTFVKDPGSHLRTKSINEIFKRKSWALDMSENMVYDDDELLEEEQLLEEQMLNEDEITKRTNIIKTIDDQLHNLESPDNLNPEANTITNSNASTTPGSPASPETVGEDNQQLSPNSRANRKMFVEDDQQGEILLNKGSLSLEIKVGVWKKKNWFLFPSGLYYQRESFLTKFKDNSNNSTSSSSSNHNNVSSNNNSSTTVNIANNADNYERWKPKDKKKKGLELFLSRKDIKTAGTSAMSFMLDELCFIVERHEPNPNNPTANPAHNSANPDHNAYYFKTPTNEDLTAWTEAFQFLLES